MASRSPWSKSCHLDDRLRAVLEEYGTLGVPLIIQMDPESRTTHVYEAGNLLQRELSELRLSDELTMPFDTQALFDELDA